MTIHVLLVDDEPALSAALQPVLTAAGYRVTAAADGRGALRLARDIEPDVVLLDLGLPDLDGKDVIQQIRARSDVPIIVISARHQEGEKIAALDEGADDYVNKPFEIGELLARIRAAERRRNRAFANPTSYMAGELEIDFVARRVMLGGEAVRMSPKEYDLLQLLASNAGQVVTHKRLLGVGWGPEATDTQYLRVYIGLLRQKIEADPSEPRLLLTEPGVGYRLVAPR
ncbi:response regulator [Sphingomonas crocodyli]|uniref:Response regulator transcription factor n=1 Tax=Sphingomonas crocodyli TaxID=1979270 RepID=A0A437LYS7_9SPHN|nr:response regulator transcription factor [Sphingomonas crocodyli]RVT90496.1 response regulator transcription factor [Sphingomonas crocodyli]